MIKAREWPVRAMYLLIAAALAISLIITAAPALKVSADCTADVCAEWERVSTPTMNDWVLTPENTIIDYALASGGDVAYAIVYGYDEDWSNEGYRLLKSEDGAATWADLTDELDDVIDPDNENNNYIDELVLVGTDWVDPDFVAVAVWWYDYDGGGYYYLNVFFSTDGGDNFIDAGEVEEDGVYFDDPDDVSDLAVSYEATGKRDIAIAGQDNSGESALFRCTVTGDTPGPWRDTTEYDGWDDNNNLMGTAYTSQFVTDIIFSPDWGTDRTILAVTICVYGGASGYWYGAIHLQSGAWGATTGNWNLDGDFTDAVLVKEDVWIPMFLMYDDGRGIAGVVLPEDYSGTDPDTRYAWVWTNYVIDYYSTFSGNAVGEILRVRNGSVDDVDTQITDMPWLTNVSYQGYIAEGKAIAGVLAYSQSDYIDLPDLVKPCCDGVQVYRNAGIANMEICCLEWDEACKPPTGRTSMAVSYVSDDKAYAVALHDYIEDGDEDAWSVSFDDGDTWNQLSLIDTYISYVSDVAVSPDCNKNMLVTVAEDIWAYDQYLPGGYNEFAPWECVILYPVRTDYYDVRYIYCDSVWVYAEAFPEAGFDYYSGHWLRTWCGPLLGDNTDDTPSDMERGLLRLAPEETDGMTVYLVDRMSDTIYWNELETLACWKTRSSAAGGIDEIADLAVKDEATIYALDIDGNVAMSDDHGASLTWTDSVDSEVDDGWTIAVHGDDILVGGQDADVGYSDDGGATFTALDDVPTPTNGSDDVYVTLAFDTYFVQNDTIYAALRHAYYDNGIYIWVIGESEEWHRTSAEPYNYTGLVLDRPSPSNPYTSAATGGVLYASYYTREPEYVGNCDYCGCDESGDYECWHSGVARCLTPITELCCGVGEAEWDYLTWGLDYDVLFYMGPQALKICGCLTSDSNSRLYVVDGYDVDESYDAYDMEDGEFGAVWTFEDCYAKKAVELTYPSDNVVVGADACGCCNAPFALKWDRLCDACCYEIQFARDEDFTDIVPVEDMISLKGDSIDGPYYNYFDCYCPLAPMTPSAWVGCYFNPEGTYYWRIRASQAETCQEIHSWWSEAQSFTVSPTAAAGAIELVSPVPGATGVAIKNVGFSWDLTADADKFDWVLSTNADLSSPVESKTGLNATAYTCTKTLAYGTTYYWQVIAYNDGAAISSSAVGTFTTAPTGAFCCPQCGLCFDTQAALQAHIADAHPAQPATPFWVWVVIAIGAVLVIVVIVLIFRTRRV